jgi:hypothetical protein
MQCSISAPPRNRCCSRQTASITYSERARARVCVWSSLPSIQCTCAVLCNQRPVWLYNIFSALPHKRHDFRKKKVAELLSETFLILRKLRQDITTNYIGLHVKYPLFSSYLMRPQYSRYIFEICWNAFYKNPPSGKWVVPCGRADMKKLTVASNLVHRTAILTLCKTSALQPDPPVRWKKKCRHETGTEELIK